MAEMKEEVKDEQEILRRVFNILCENSPELVGYCLLTVIRPPQVLLEGTNKRSVFVNFMDYCKAMHRQPDHVRAYLLSEMGTTGTLDGQQRLVVRGKFTPNNFKGNLQRYVWEYVMCCGCKSADTIFSREIRDHIRRFFVTCEKCGLRRSAMFIKLNKVYGGRRRKT